LTSIGASATCPLSCPSRIVPTSLPGDWFAGTAEDYQAEASSYIAYSGPFHVDEEKQTLTHSMFVSLFPDWTGQTQPRRVKLEGDTLRLGTASPIQSSGKTVNSELIWRRAESN
jgi:hypothetical protein